jgi:trypsin
MCGGSVIDTGWILTAAHCITEDLERLQISIDVYVHDTYRYSAVELVIHPLWNESAGDGHDLALVRIPSYATEAGGGIPEAKKVQVGAPADPGAYAVGEIATMVGRGETFLGSGASPGLRDVHIPLHSDSYMSDIYDPWYWSDSWNEPLMIGAGWPTQTACKGDSGGPLTVNRSGVTVQVGVFSFFWPRGESIMLVSCAQPAAYAELSGGQMAWIGATVPGVAARWGTCGVRNPRLRGLETLGRWVATYVDTGSDSTGPDKDGTYRWSISCVPLEPDRKGPVDRYLSPPLVNQ